MGANAVICGETVIVRMISAKMGYLVEAFNKMKHMLQNTVPGDVLDNQKKSDSRLASRATIYGKRHDIRRLTVVIVVTPGPRGRRSHSAQDLPACDAGQVTIIIIIIMIRIIIIVVVVVVIVKLTITFIIIRAIILTILLFRKSSSFGNAKRGGRYR